MVKSGVIMGGLYNTSVDVWQRHMLRNLWQLTILVWNVVQTWYPRWLVSMFEAFWRSFWKDHPTKARKLGVILARLVIINWQISIGSLSSFNKHTNTTSQPTAFLRLLPNLSHIYVYIYILYYRSMVPQDSPSTLIPPFQPWSGSLHSLHSLFKKRRTASDLCSWRFFSAEKMCFQSNSLGDLDKKTKTQTAFLVGYPSEMWCQMLLQDFIYMYSKCQVTKTGGWWILF